MTDLDRREVGDNKKSYGLIGFLEGPKNHFTPLFVLSGLGILVEAILMIGIVQTDGFIQQVLTIFVAVFLLVFLVGLLVIAFLRPQHLYSPSEYGHPTSALEYADALRRGHSAPERLETEQIVAVEGQASIGESDRARTEQLSEIGALTSDKPQDKTSWKTILFEEILSQQMNFERAEEAFEHVQAEEQDKAKRTATELTYLYYRFKNGDTEALQRLETMAENARSVPERAAETYSYLGLAFQLAGSHQKAEGAYQTAIELATSERQRAVAISYMASAQFQLQRNEEALKTIEEAIASTSDGEAVAILYEGLARHYDETDQQELKALALEKALEHKPEETSLRFDAARAYGDSDFDALSLLHYQIILQISPQNSGALNNAGVDYAALNMRTLAVDSYRKAYALGHTLSAANLGYLYVKSGFTDDAFCLLDEARHQDNPHPNVAAAIASISATREQDEATEKSILKSAREQRAFLSAYAECYFSPSTSPANFAGEWQSDEGYKISISQHGHTVEATWSSNKKNYTFKGQVHRGTAKIATISGRNPDGSIWASTDTIADSGYAYLSLDVRSLAIMGLKGNDPIFMRLNRMN